MKFYRALSIVLFLSLLAVSLFAYSLDQDWQAAYEAVRLRQVQAEAQQQDDFYRGVYNSCISLVVKNLGPMSGAVCNQFTAGARGNDAWENKENFEGYKPDLVVPPAARPKPDQQKPAESNRPVATPTPRPRQSGESGA